MSQVAYSNIHTRINILWVHIDSVHDGFDDFFVHYCILAEPSKLHFSRQNGSRVIFGKLDYLLQCAFDKRSEFGLCSHRSNYAPALIPAQLPSGRKAFGTKPPARRTLRTIPPFRIAGWPTATRLLSAIDGADLETRFFCFGCLHSSRDTDGRYS